MPVDSRGVLFELDVRVQPRGARPAGRRIAMTAADAPTTSVGRSSTNEFHAPQSRHRPSHLGDCAPHSWQTKTVLGDLLI